MEQRFFSVTPETKAKIMGFQAVLQLYVVKDSVDLPQTEIDAFPKEGRNCLR